MKRLPRTLGRTSRARGEKRRRDASDTYGIRRAVSENPREANNRIYASAAQGQQRKVTALGTDYPGNSRKWLSRYEVRGFWGPRTSRLFERSRGKFGGFLERRCHGSARWAGLF